MKKVGRKRPDGPREWERQRRTDPVAALMHIYNVLGPRAGCGACKCDGCRYEMTEAMETARAFLGVKKGAYPATYTKKRRGGASDPQGKP